MCIDEQSQYCYTAQSRRMSSLGIRNYASEKKRLMCVEMWKAKTKCPSCSKLELEVEKQSGDCTIHVPTTCVVCLPYARSTYPCVDPQPIMAPVAPVYTCLCSKCKGSKEVTPRTIYNHLLRDQEQLDILPSTTTDSYFLLKSHISRTSELLKDIQGVHGLPDLAADHGGSPSEGSGALLAIYCYTFY